MSVEHYILPAYMQKPTIFDEPADPIDGRKYVYGQIMDWVLDKKVLTFDGMNNLSADLRARLLEKYSLNTLTIADSESDTDGTTKFLFKLEGGEPPVHVESVFIPGPGRATVCLSTQAGCACGCVFCTTGTLGPGRNLEYEEIVLQLLNIEAELGQKVTHIVIMGMGEPLHNYGATTRAIRFFEDSKLNISARRITLSTIGVPDRIRKLADDGVRVELAVSMHSADEENRRTLIPYDGLASIAETMASVDYFFEKTGRLPTFEYVLIKDVNDRQSDADALVSLIRNKQCKVNLIRMNGEVNGYVGASGNAVHRFKDYLLEQGIKVTLRKSAGADIKAGCGQLAPGS